MSKVKHYELAGLGKLGKEIKISPKALVSINKPNMTMTFPEESVSIVIGIGENHTAELVMDKMAYEALQKSEVNIVMHKDFVKQYGL